MFPYFYYAPIYAILNPISYLSMSNVLFVTCIVVSPVDGI